MSNIVKVRLQTTTQYSGAADAASKILKNEGAAAFYKGTLTPLIGIGACVSVQFGAFHYARRAFERQNAAKTGVLESPQPLSYSQYYAAGAFAGIANTLMSSPIEHIRIRLQTQPHGAARLYNGPIDCVKKLCAHEGVLKGLYRGTGVTWFREAQAYGVWFTAFEFMMNQDAKRNGIERKEIPTWKIALYGGLAGEALWLGSYPFDVIKSKMQSDGFGAEQKYKSMRDTFAQTWRGEGMRGFWRGLGPTLLRAMPVSAGTFATLYKITKCVSERSRLRRPELLLVFGGQLLAVCMSLESDHSAESGICSILAHLESATVTATSVRILALATFLSMQSSGFLLSERLVHHVLCFLFEFGAGLGVDLRALELGCLRSRTVREVHVESSCNGVLVKVGELGILECAHHGLINLLLNVGLLVGRTSRGNDTLVSVFVEAFILGERSFGFVGSGNLISGGRSQVVACRVCNNTTGSLVETPVLARLSGAAENTSDEVDASKTGADVPVVVGRNGVGDPGWVCVGVNNTNGGNVVETALVQQNVVLHGVQADDQIGLEGALCFKLLLETFDLLVILIDDLCATSAQDLRAVCDAARNPAVEEVTATGQFSSLGNNSLLAVTSTDKEDQTTTLGDTTNDSTCSAQVGGGLVKRDDVNTLTYTKDVASVGRVPERGRVTQMGLRGKKEFEGDVVG
ncbi:hypothetical protein D6C82_03729 [Aureobasidium pullulans]|nr:hypothetical protein D6C82_03729 [Aureobasidium pullulans]